MPLFRKGQEKFIFRTVNEELRVAASKGDLTELRNLIRKGAKFVPDKEGRTALHLAAVNGHADLVRELIEHGCDINYQDKLGYTPLHRTCLEGYAEVARILLDSGADTDRQDVVQENTALHDAAWHGYSSCMELLLQGRANIYIRNKGGATALHLCCQSGHNTCCKILLNRGCKPDVKDKYDDTPLHTACRYLHAGVTKLLLGSNMNPNDQNKNGDTPLHLACNLGQKKLVRLLLQHGASFTIKNRQGETPMDISVRKKLRELIEVLSQTSPQKPVMVGKMPWKCRRTKIREKLQTAREQGSSWQLLFQDWPPEKAPLVSGGDLSPRVNRMSAGQCFGGDVNPNMHKSHSSMPCGHHCFRMAKGVLVNGIGLHHDLLDEVDECHEDLSNEINDLRQSTDRKIQHLNMAVKKLGTNVQRSSRRQALQAAKMKLSASSSQSHSQNRNSAHGRSPSNLPQPHGGGTEGQMTGHVSRKTRNSARMVRSKSESELETDIEREHRSFALESDGSASNLSDDLYIDPEIHLPPNFTAGTIRKKIRFRENNYNDYRNRKRPEPLVEHISGEREILPESTSSISSLERNVALSVSGTTESAALLKERYELSAKKFNRELEFDSNSFQESSCTTPNSHNYTHEESEVSSARNSISSYQSNVSASQLSHTQSFQQSLDSGYGTSHTTSNPPSSAPLPTSGSPVTRFGSVSQVPSPSIDSGIPASPYYTKDLLLTTGSSGGSDSPEVAMRQAVNKPIPSMNTSNQNSQNQNQIQTGNGTINRSISSINKSMTSINKSTPTLNKSLQSIRTEAETQTDSCTDDGGDAISISDAGGHYEHEYTEVENISSQFPQTLNSRRNPPKLTIPPPPTKPLPPLPPTRSSKTHIAGRAYNSRTLGPCMSTNV